VTVEEGALQGGFGSAVLECLSELDLLEVPVKRIGLPDSFAEHGSPSVLRRHYGLDPEGIAHMAREFLEAHLGVTHQ
ncbi:MAG: 1-deoxy-D-xylulose-5-phosphate synthase, partial [Gemmatimonadetes bacterium]|nr:1-deoxy-D-xylulose-5-phosphate synthase [Gemmatimonadota bacterium]NIX42305.1 1-deoxy-D-xylulose-5-phosphate synthase [Gemmatimonadota bacterium]